MPVTGQLEVFGNEGEVYQSHNINLGSPSIAGALELFVDGDMWLESLTIYHFASIWNPKRDHDQKLDPKTAHT